MERKITWASAITLLVAIVGWAASTGSRVATLEERSAAQEQRLTKNEKDADEYRNNMGEVRERLARIEALIERFARH